MHVALHGWHRLLTMIASHLLLMMPGPWPAWVTHLPSIPSCFVAMSVVCRGETMHCSFHYLLTDKSSVLVVIWNIYYLWCQNGGLDCSFTWKCNHNVDLCCDNSSRVWFLTFLTAHPVCRGGFRPGFSPGFLILGCTPNSCMKGGLWSTWADRWYKAKHQRQWGGCGRGFPPQVGLRASSRIIFTLEILWEHITTYVNFKFEFIIWNEL